MSAPNDSLPMTAPTPSGGDAAAPSARAQEMISALTGSAAMMQSRALDNEIIHEWATAKGELSRYVADVESQLRAARRNADTAWEQAGAMAEKVESLSAHQTCACSFDRKDDVCFHHSPALLAARREVEGRAALLREIATLAAGPAIYSSVAYSASPFKALLERIAALAATTQEPR